MNHLEIREAAYRPDDNKNYELSILIGVDSLVYTFAGFGEQVVFLKKIALDISSKKMPVQSQLEAIFQTEAPIKGQFSKVKIAVFSEFFTFVPQRLFNPESKEQYLQKIADLTNLQTVLFTTSEAHAITTVFAIEKKLHGFLATAFPGCGIYNAQAIIVEKLLRLGDGKTVYCHFQSRKITVFVVENRNLLLCNEYPFQNAQDCLYFLLLIFDQFRLSQDETPVSLAGDLTEDSEIYRLLLKYFKKLNFLTDLFNEMSGEKLKTQPPHYRLAILSLVKYNPQ